jgi:hypothetical protein
MNKRRLLKLADLLEADAKNRRGVKFDLGVVGNAEKVENGKVSLDCGTTACAMGLAAISGAFKRAGLGYKITDVGYGFGASFYIGTTVNGRKCDYDDAAIEIFDLTYDQANFLFTPGWYPPGMNLMGGKAERFVAKRIRDLVAGKVSP